MQMDPGESEKHFAADIQQPIKIYWFIESIDLAMWRLLPQRKQAMPKRALVGFQYIVLHVWEAGGWFNIKTTSYQYRKSHSGDKTILRPSYLHNGISYTGKMASWYWIRAQLSIPWKSNYTILLALCVGDLLVHYNDVIMRTVVSQITSLTIVYSTVYSGADQRKHQSSASLAFVRGIHRRPVNSLHKWPVTRKMVPFDDIIMHCASHWTPWGLITYPCLRYLLLVPKATWHK